MMRRASTPRVASAIGAGLISALLIAALGSTASAQDPAERQKQLQQQLQKQTATVNELTKEAADAVAQLEQTQKQFDAATSRVITARATESLALKRKLAVDQQLARAQAAEAIGQSLVNQNEKVLTAAQDVRNNMARSAYEGGGSEKLALVLNPLNAAELADRMYMVEKVTDVQQSAIGDLKAAQAAAIALQAQLLDARRVTATLSLQSKAALAQAEDARKQAAEAQAQLAVLVKQKQQASAAIEKHKQAEADRLAQLKAESDRITALLSSKRKPGSAPPPGGGSLRYPVSAPVTSGFGYRFHPVLHYQRLHTGTDFGADCGAPIYAAGAGTIIDAGWSGGYGNRIVIDHGSVATVYGHLSSIAKSGGTVASGELIGYVGTTGLSTGCHLHFETRIDGEPVDPMRFLG